MLLRWHEKSFIQVFCWESWLLAEFLTFPLDVWKGRNGMDFLCSRSVFVDRDFPVRTEFSDNRGKTCERAVNMFADFSSVYRSIANVDRKWTMEIHRKIIEVRKRKIYVRRLTNVYSNIYARIHAWCIRFADHNMNIWNVIFKFLEKYIGYEIHKIYINV